ncbi:transcriptional regulator [Streptomyces griseus]
MTTVSTTSPITPEDRWGAIGTYGAHGMTGGEALARNFDHAAGAGIPPLTTSDGVVVRLRYLAWNSRGSDCLAQAGIRVNHRTMSRWKNGTQRPRPADLLKINQAFWQCRRASLAEHYKRRMWDNGRGTRIEIYPVDQAAVQPGRKRDLRMRCINVRREWEPIVDAWSTNDHAGLDDLWCRITEALGSDHDAYIFVSHLGFGI